MALLRHDVLHPFYIITTDFTVHFTYQIMDQGGPGHERPTLSTGPVTEMVRPRASAENKSLGLRFARMVSVLRTT